MLRARWWRERSWEDRAWYGLLLANLAALVYLVVRAPAADATWVYRGTIWVDVAALAWWVGRAVHATVIRLRGRSGTARANTGDSEPSGPN
jgi:hypothetical protein